MFQFLQPIWLLALAGIAIPVVIHLWNQRPGKILKVGSVSLVTENLQRYQNRIQLSEILLLILRCLLISFIALALTGPEWRSSGGSHAKGWVLMDRKGISNTYQHFKSSIDSLLLAGYEFHFFEEGFKKEKLEQALADTSADSLSDASYRDIMAALNRQVDAALPLYVFTNQYLRNFAGARTEVLLNLHWRMYIPDTIVSSSTADTAALHITIFTQHYATDAHYLAAALEAIRQFSKKNITVKQVKNIGEMPDRQDWLFWLEDTMPLNLSHAINIVSYAGGRPREGASAILPADGSLFAAVSVNKLIIEKDGIDDVQDVRWQDGFGHPVLTAQKQSQQTLYKLYTHINPVWSELPWSDNFPVILYTLIYPRDAPAVFGDKTNRTLIDPAQAMPLLQASKDDKAKSVSYTVTQLTGVCWIIAFILFFAERSLSFFYSKSKANG